MRASKRLVENPQKKKTLRMPRGAAHFADPLFEWLPVVGVVALLGWTYYVYVVILCCDLIENDAVGALLATAFHVLFLLCVWSFVYTIMAGPGRVPAYFSLSQHEKERLDRVKSFDERRQCLEELGDKRGVLTLGMDGCVRYCAECRRIKPDRCHHCSWCRRCVLKMDHHCPWFNNCVSFTTQKSFLLTTVYACLLAGFTATTSIIHAFYSWFNAGFSFATVNISAVVLGGAYLSIGIGSFFYIHLGNLYRNVTTLENMRATMFREADDSFDLGRTKNVEQVFGLSKPLWALPVFTSLGDGARFPTKFHPDPDRLQLPLVPTVKDAPAATPGSLCAGATARPPALVPAVLPATMGTGNGFAVARPPPPLRGPSLVGPTQTVPQYADYPRMVPLQQPSTAAATAPQAAQPLAAPH